MEISTYLNIEDVFLSIKQEFKKIIIDDKKLIEQLFELKSDKSRKSLSSNHIKPLSHTKGAKPEAVTTHFIKRLFNIIGISDDLIVPEVRLNSINGFKGKTINKYPDLAIINKSFKKDVNKSLLFEIESLNKDLTKENDGEGIEQALEWFHQSIGLYREYNAIITNFNEWYFLKFDKRGKRVITKKTPNEILEIIRFVAIGQERSYLEDERGEAISKQFFEEFSKRLKMLIDPQNNKIRILGSYGRPLLENKKYDYNKINFYRTNFHRLLFIKILLDWKLLKIDPVEEIFIHEEKRNYYNTLRDLFFKVLNNDKERVDVFEQFKNLPFLNGGLFRLTNLEQEYPNIALNSDAINDIWNLLKRYNFTFNIESPKKRKSNNINPNILGYIFEKSIGDFRKATGAYYTRSEIANYISKSILHRYLLDKINEKFYKYKIHALNQIFMYENQIQQKITDFLLALLRDLKICDPFVGSGAFLVSIGEEIVNIYKFVYKNIKKWDLKYNDIRVIENDVRPFKDLYTMKVFIIQNNLYGIDINPSAIDICKLRLWLWITQPPSALDIINLVLNPLPNIEYNIREGNSFIGYTEAVLKIDQIDKKTREKITFVSISEWADKKEFSLSQMLEDRNHKIKEYYNERNSDRRNLLKEEIKDITLQYNYNFDNLLLNNFKEQDIIGKIIIIKPSEIDRQNFTNIHSMVLKAKGKIEFDISDEIKKKILMDDKGQLIKGLIFRKKSITIQNRVFIPNREDNFISQIPLEIITKIADFIDINGIREIEIKYFITNEDLKDIKRFHWSMEFSDFFNSKGFDIIITNPPYGNILAPIEKKILTLKDNITEDIYLNFLMKMSRKEISFKYAGILCPKSYLLRQKYLGFRNQFLKSNGIYEIMDIGSKQFQGATNEVQIIFFNTNKNYSEKIEVKDFLQNDIIISYNRKKDTKDTPVLDKLRICKNKNCQYYDTTSSYYYYTFEKKCPICNEQTIPLNRIRIKTTIDIYKLLDKIEKIGDLNYLNSIDFPKIKRGEEDKGLKAVKKYLRNDVDGSCYFIKARTDFNYYFIKHNKSFNLKDISSKILKGENYEYYVKPKLLIKHNSIIPEAIYTEDPVCFTSSIYSQLHKEKKELKYLCALINSALIQFYCIYGINNQKDTTINLNQYMIRHLPLKNSNEITKSEIAFKVHKIIENLRMSNGKYNTLTSQLLREIDDFVFSLYSITDDEKNIILNNLKKQVKYFENIYGEI